MILNEVRASLCSKTLTSYIRISQYVLFHFLRFQVFIQESQLIPFYNLYKS